MDLQIIRTREEAHDIVNVQSVPTVLTEETKRAVLPKCPSPVKIVHAAAVPSGVKDGGKGSNGRYFTGNFTDIRTDPPSGRNSKQGRRSPPEQRNVHSPEKEFRARRNSGMGFHMCVCLKAF